MILNISCLVNIFLTLWIQVYILTVILQMFLYFNVFKVMNYEFLTFWALYLKLNITVNFNSEFKNVVIIDEAYLSYCIYDWYIECIIEEK